MPLVDIVVGRLAAFTVKTLAINVPVKIVEKLKVPVNAKAVTFLLIKCTLNSPLELFNLLSILRLI